MSVFTVFVRTLLIAVVLAGLIFVVARVIESVVT